MIGIYKITNPKKKIYIGQSIDIEKRWKSYKRIDCKSQIKLYHSLKKYGYEKHKFEIVQLCDREQLNELEKYYVDLFQTFNNKFGLNLKDGGGVHGAMSDETKLKCSISRKGIKKSAESVRKTILGNTGQKRSIETRLKISNSRKGMILSEETKLKMSISSKNMSQETKDKIGNAGKKLILDTQMGIFYLGAKEAAEAYNIHSGTLRNKLSKPIKNDTNFIYV